YLYIQQQRYGDKLTYNIHELPTYDDYRIPKLILQPIVENAIYHGIKPVDWPGRICLDVSEDGDSLVISITDNGQGFPNHQGNLVEIQAEEFTSSGVGLKNVYQRLKLEFGDPFHMTIQSEKNRSTTISLYFPKS
ncbi:sensor histidine kinase, partial [Enterococcus faecalis]|nr:sensor histidine kinase [Enterococcus faecalis]